MKVFVTRPIPAAGMRRLEAAAAVRVSGATANEGPDRRELRAGVRWCDVLVSLLTEAIDAELLAANDRLRGVSNYAVGVDNIDLDAATRNGIPVGNTPDVLTESTADLTWALILGVARNLVAGDAFLRAGRYRRWGPETLLGHDVSPGGDGRRKTLGVIGFGRIGRAVARRARGFDMRVLAYGPRSRAAIEASALAEWAELDELLGASDFVTLHAPGSRRNRHLIGARELRLMGPGAFLINTARGTLVDERALVAALHEGVIAGAALDVYEREPELVPGLAQAPNTLLLPHLGSATRATRDRMAEIAADNAIAMGRWERAPHCVNPEVYAQPAWARRRSAAGGAGPGRDPEDNPGEPSDDPRDDAAGTDPATISRGRGAK